MRKIYVRRTIRNFLLAALAALLLWGMSGFPLPVEMAFRRSERQNLAERSEIVWRYRGDEDMLVGLSRQYAHVWNSGGSLVFWPRQEGGTLLHLPAQTRYQEGGEIRFGPSLLVPDPPQDAVDARLTITLSIGDWMEDYTITGERQDGVFFFQLRERYQSEPSDRSSHEMAAFEFLPYQPPVTGNGGYPYTLEFFDTEGKLISTIRQEGWLAETP